MPLPLELIKLHCRVDHAEEDALFEQYKSAAKHYIESQLDRPLDDGQNVEFAENAISINPAIQQAMLMLIAHWYEHREAVAIGNISHEIAQGVSRLIQPYRIMGV